MTLLILGLIVFFAIHLVPTAPALEARAVDRVGANGWRGLFSLIATAGLFLIVAGMARAPYIVLWPASPLARGLALIAVPVAFVLLAAAYLPSNVKRVTPHPMLWAVTLWACAHLLANGDVAGVLLFGSFLVYALIDRWSSNRRGAAVARGRQPLWADALALVAGLIGAVLVAHYHASLFGVAVR